MVNWEKKFNYHILWLIRQFISVLSLSKEYDGVVIFGTNLSRVLPFLLDRRKIKFAVYNEIGNGGVLSRLVDRINFKLHSEIICFSTLERHDLYVDKNKVKFGGVIPNIPNINYEYLPVTKPNNEGVVYCGIINKHRFNEEAISKIKSSKYSFHLLGPLDNLNLSDCDNITYHGCKSHDEAVSFQSLFRFSLLSYPVDDLNNNYCAPIKIYEYINSGCVCVSVNSNKGLEGLLSKYPAIFTLLDYIDEYEFCEEDYNSQREKFMSEELGVLNRQLEKFALS